MAWRAGPLAPERFTTARMVIRLWRPDDAEALSAAIIADLGHLRLWMEWARDEPKPVESKRALIEEWRRDFHRPGGGGGAAYGLFSPDERELWGSIGYHHRIGEGAREIGFWMRSSQLNQGLITEAAGALTWLGIMFMNLLRMEIHCDPTNLASARVPAKLGYQLHTTMQRQIKDMKLPPRNTIVWAMNKSAFPSTTSANFAPVTIGNQLANAFIEGAPEV